jgi:hypothetical protein
VLVYSSSLSCEIEEKKERAGEGGEDKEGGGEKAE